MDASFEILLPAEVDLIELGFNVPMFEWQAVKYPQGPPEYFFGRNFHLKASSHDVIGYSKSLLPTEYQIKKWQVIELFGDGLDIYYGLRFDGNEVEEEGFGFLDLLNFLIAKEPLWMFAFGPQFDGFSKICHGRIEDIVNRLADPITSLEGFLMLGRS